MTWLTGYDALLVHIPGDVTACFSCGGSMGLAADGAMLMVDLQHTKKKKNNEKWQTLSENSVIWCWTGKIYSLIVIFLITA